MKTFVLSYIASIGLNGMGYMQLCMYICIGPILSVCLIWRLKIVYIIMVQYILCNINCLYNV